MKYSGRFKMIVKCIDNKWYSNSLTVGNEYEVVDSTDTAYKVYSEAWLYEWFDKEMFEEVDTDKSEPLPFNVNDLVVISNQRRKGAFVVKETYGDTAVQIMNHAGEQHCFDVKRLELYSEIKEDSMKAKFIGATNRSFVSDKFYDVSRVFNDGKTYELIAEDGNPKCVHVSWLADIAKHETEKNEVVEKPEKFHSSHYESKGIECIELITSNKLDFCRSSIIKYAFRAGNKEGQGKLDIKKIIDYALLLALQEDIEFSKEDAQSIIDYRFGWKESR